MSERAEIPEAKDPFEKRVAITIAIIAVLFSIVSNFAEHTKTSAIIKTNQASDQWSFYQSKSMKGHILESEIEMISILGKNQGKEERIGKAVTAIRNDQKRYTAEKDEIKAKAEELEGEARHESKINQRCEFSILVFQISIILCSVAILSRWKGIWVVGILSSLAGIGLGISALFV